MVLPNGSVKTSYMKLSSQVYKGGLERRLLIYNSVLHIIQILIII